MKLKWKLLLILAIVILCVNAFLNKVSIRNFHNISNSRQQSIDNEFFITDYLPTSKVFNLKLRPVTVILDSAWTESAWLEEAHLFGTSLRKTVGDCNLAIQIDTVTTTEFIYSLELLSDSLGGALFYNPTNKQHEGNLRYFPDTLKIVVLEKSIVDSLGWKQPMVTDTLLYIRSYNSNY